jgi:hypothetical protein
VNTWFLSKLWRTYRQNRKLIATIRKLHDDRVLAWEMAEANVRLLRERNADLKRQLESARAMQERSDLAVMAKEFEIRDLMRERKQDEERAV